jgi:hypothetical protein
MFEIKAVRGRKILFRKTYNDEQEAVRKQQELEAMYWNTATVSFTNLSFFKK